VVIQHEKCKVVNGQKSGKDQQESRYGFMDVIGTKMWRRWAAAAVAMLVLSIGVAVLVRRGSTPAAHPALNLLVVTLDTTRADHLGAYGAVKAATPAFDRIAREGVLFEHAVTAAPLTLPAHATLFTAKYPGRHGVRDNGGFFLDAKETTLAERLKADGFATGGFVGAYVLDRRWGIAQGFDTYFDDFDIGKAKGSMLASVERPGNEVADHALAWLEGVAASRFFAWVHFYDAHSPYDPPEPFRSAFAGSPYAGEIAFVDAQVQRLIAFLERRDLLNKTIVVVVGDHGESLGEHGEASHGFFVYESAVRVPFAMLAPGDGMRGRRVTDVVRTVDLVPTLLDLLGRQPAEKVDGRSVVPLMTGAVRELGLDAYSEAMYPRYHFGWSALHALTSGRYKYVDAPRPELYDLVNDPGETHNDYEKRRPLAAKMSQSLRVLEGATDPNLRNATVEVDPEARARLAALGYIGTFVSEAASQHTALADPKDKIELFNLLTKAREELQDRTHASNAGLAMLERVVAKDPQVIDGWLLMGNEYAERRQFDRAIASFQRALALKPDYDLAVINMARVYRLLGRPGDAVVGLSELLRTNPANLQARQQLAQALLENGQAADAEGELKRVLDQDPNMAAARGSLGALRLQQGDPAAADRELRAALALQPNLPLAHFNLALVAEQNGDLAAAAAEYLQEIREHPGSYMAQFNLGKVYERTGNRQGQLTAYQGAVESNPAFAEGYFFLAKLHFDLQQLDAAARNARQGLALQPAGQWSPLGHFVLGDVYAAQGRRDQAKAEVEKGRRVAAAVRK
jgi:arylsulfatase A-like enzyme/Tfp pilus assembly protein PilF